MLKDGKYFHVRELACHDGTAYPDAFADRLPELIQLLDTIREAWGSPITVISGYRSQAHNASLVEANEARGAHQVASGSQHVEGRAADVRPVHGSAQSLFELIMSMHRAGKLPQLGGIAVYPASKWVHVDTYHAPDGHLRTWRGV